MASRSTGCLLCVKRRVKCDERRPECARCEKYGATCPGYTRSFKFIPGKPYRSRRPPQIHAPTCERRVVDPASNFTVSTNLEGLILDAHPLTLSSPSTCLSQSLSVLIDDISQPYSAISTHIVSRWFFFLPAAYGRNETLDATIRCFTAHHFSKKTNNEQIARYSRFAYVNSLNRLRVSLNNRKESLSTDNFCAVLLLCLYELFGNTQEPDTWMRHAKAVSQLAEIRGPHCYEDPFNNTLLKAARGLIIMHSLFSGEECFLASQKWHAVMKLPIRSFSTEELEVLLEEFIALLTIAPSLVHSLYEIRGADHTNPTTWGKMSEILTRFLDMQTKLLAWYGKYSCVAPQPYERPSLTDNTRYPIVLHYTDVNIASLFCSYYAYMGIVHEALRILGYPGNHEVMIAYFRDQICKSVEYNSAGLLGPYRMGFPLRAAFEVADLDTRLWIKDQLVNMSQRYAAMRPQTFEPILDSVASLTSRT